MLSYAVLHSNIGKMIANSVSDNVLITCIQKLERRDTTLMYTRLE